MSEHTDSTTVWGAIFSRIGAVLADADLDENDRAQSRKNRAIHEETKRRTAKIVREAEGGEDEEDAADETAQERDIRERCGVDFPAYDATRHDLGIRDRERTSSRTSAKEIASTVNGRVGR